MKIDLKLEAIASPDWETRFGTAWHDLLAHASEPSVFLSPEWIGAWWRAYGAEREARFFAAWGGPGELIGLAPLYARRLRLAGLPSPRIIGIMADEEVGSEYLGVLTRPGTEERVLSALAEALQGEWALADLRGLRGTLARLIPAALAEGMPRRLRSERNPCSRIALPDDYEAYLRSLGQKFRATLRYRTNRLLKTHAVQCLRTTRPEDLDPHLARFFAMHQKRWAARGRPGSFRDQRMRAFYRDAAGAFLRRGWLRFYHLEVDGVIRASQFGLAHGGVLYSLQEAFDDSFRPQGVGGMGVVLRGMAIRESIAEGLSAYDFLGGTNEFKARWGTSIHYVERLLIGAPGLAGGLAFAATARRARAKEWARARTPARLLSVWHRVSRYWARGTLPADIVGVEET